ncbi:glutaminyl-peptide cyclotransferase [Elizabethkingia sp. JS20170427COW]|uniref:glutaminyl-peptide cyclotransferase n=1 Tax=Elizabethkingia sp. JS20170427COW TaxID=2583851 RepID=UPI0011106501|nr:glutaminyl-peptide cyclotransferase [Elizabethkingia sp. JS20170427COW]QCX53944.1 glutaminyl-peptide cyclotransferase [Elizabethkingia sp. JS20170427COW]
MKRNIILGCVALAFLASCNKDKEIIKSIQDYNAEMETKGYHFGDEIKLPQVVLDNAESVSISFGETETPNTKIDPAHYVLGNNDITFNIKTKSGKMLYQDASITVLANKPEQNIAYDLVAEYPHNPQYFTQGFELDGNTVYESVGQLGESKMMKYTLGQTTPSVSIPQGNDIFSEGSTLVGDKVYQLTWQNKLGYIYHKSDLSLVSQFDYPSEIAEGWGLTYDGKDLIVSDGTSNLYFVNPNDTTKVVKRIGVAGSELVYGQLNELEYHQGFIYANVWQQPVVIKINPKTGEVVAKYDFTKIAQQNTKGSDDVLNGVTFKGENMLVTGKNWNKIYEVKLK